tara:strand:- start:4266 stop:4922 length:657 start_codon:yes stop_codon:yes gene_type:complete
MINKLSIKVALLALTFSLIPASHAGVFANEPPTLESSGSVAAYKDNFIDFAVENLKTRHGDVTQTRETLREIFSINESERSISNRRFIELQMKKYQTESPQKLKERVDVIPMGLKVALFIHLTEWGQNSLLSEYKNPFNLKDNFGKLIKYETLDNGIRDFHEKISTTREFRTMRKDREQIKERGKAPVSVDLVDYFVPDDQRDAVIGLIMDYKLYYLD